MRWVVAVVLILATGVFNPSALQAQVGLTATRSGK